MKDTNIYIKQGRRYKPVGMFIDDAYTLSEGVWAVLKHKYSKEIVNGEYLKDLFTLNRMSNIEKVSFAELADMHRTANEIVAKIPEECRCRNLIEIVHTTLRLLKEIQEEK